MESEFDLETVSGDIDLEIKILSQGSIEFETVSGSIRMVFLKDADARFDLETASGSIVNRVTTDRPKNQNTSAMGCCALRRRAAALMSHFQRGPVILLYLSSSFIWV